MTPFVALTNIPSGTCTVHGKVTIGRPRQIRKKNPNKHRLNTCTIANNYRSYSAICVDGNVDDFYSTQSQCLQIQGCTNTNCGPCILSLNLVERGQRNRLACNASVQNVDREQSCPNISKSQPTQCSNEVIMKVCM